MTPARALSDALRGVGPADIEYADALALWFIREQAEALVALCDREMLRRNPGVHVEHEPLEEPHVRTP